MRHTIYVGDVRASKEPAEIRTLLGSCVAVCLWDPKTQIGGMNHFLLPDSTEDAMSFEPTRFGVHAMDVLIGELMMLGADRRRCVAKVFGAGHVLGVKETADSVPQRNMAFVKQFCQDEGFRIVASDLGGKDPRIVVFATDTGKAKVKHLPRASVAEKLVEKEAVKREEPPKYGDITLF
ncbi:MAG: chemotaxis protein CheD [Planctomycetes bacterium]|nr:chemotaxis protein CheD [Planctomycetota bacterium]